MDWFKGLTDMVKPELLWMVLPAIGVAFYVNGLLMKARARLEAMRAERDEYAQAFESFDPYDAPSEFKVLGVVMSKHTPAKIKVVLNKRYPERILRSNTFKDDEPTGEQ